MSYFFKQIFTGFWLRTDHHKEFWLMTLNILWVHMAARAPSHYPPDQRALLQSRARNLRQESSSPSHRSTALAQRRQLTTEGDYTVKALGTWMGGMVTESLTLLRQPPCVPQQAKQPLLMGERGRSQKVQLWVWVANTEWSWRRMCPPRKRRRTNSISYGNTGLCSDVHGTWICSPLTKQYLVLPHFDSNCRIRRLTFKILGHIFIGS